MGKYTYFRKQANPRFPPHSQLNGALCIPSLNIQNASRSSRTNKNVMKPALCISDRNTAGIEAVASVVLVAAEPLLPCP